MEEYVGVEVYPKLKIIQGKSFILRTREQTNLGA